jgi:hypothetical protein
MYLAQLGTSCRRDLAQDLSICCVAQVLLGKAQVVVTIGRKFKSPPSSSLILDYYITQHGTPALRDNSIHRIPNIQHPHTPTSNNRPTNQPNNLYNSKPQACTTKPPSSSASPAPSSRKNSTTTTCPRNAAQSANPWSTQPAPATRTSMATGRRSTAFATRRARARSCPSARLVCASLIPTETVTMTMIRMVSGCDHLHLCSALLLTIPTRHRRSHVILWLHVHDFQRRRRRCH